MKFTEDKLLSLLPAPERKKIIRLQQQVTPGEIHEAENSLINWEEKVSSVDNELRNVASTSVRSSKKVLPPVRGTKREKLDIPENKNTAKSTTTTTKLNQEAESQNKEKRISGYDFAAWEKFDVDGALEKMDAGEKASLSQREGRRKAQEYEEEQKRKRAVKHNIELEKLRNEMRSNDLTELQCKNRALREKQKGNEAFRAGENQDAMGYYSRSLALDPTSAMVYANRAMVCLRLGTLETAEDDCSRAIQLDPKYTKAYQRRAMARFKQGKYETVSNFVVY